MTEARPLLVGPVFATIDAVLREDPKYTEFRAGRLDRASFNAIVDAWSGELIARGLPASDVPFVKRLPNRSRAFVAQALVDLARLSLIPAASVDWAQADKVEALLNGYKHGSLETYIYPEEGLLLWAIATVCRPKHVLFLGSYYGYWAHWALPALPGSATLVDPDEPCCSLARENLRAAGIGHQVQVVAARGEDFLTRTGEVFDCVVIDAENPRDHPDPEQRGKRVYHSLLQACLPHLTADALLICHNILFRDETGDSAFEGIVARNEGELGAFMALAERHFVFVEVSTTEGVGVGRRRTPSAP